MWELPRKSAPVEGGDAQRRGGSQVGTLSVPLPQKARRRLAKGDIFHSLVSKFACERNATVVHRSANMKTSVRWLCHEANQVSLVYRTEGVTPFEQRATSGVLR